MQFKEKQLKNKIITIDGPSGVGKGTLAKSLAKELGCDLLDSGAIYRALAVDIFQQNIKLERENLLVDRAINLKLHFKIIDDNIRVILNSQDITADIRAEHISSLASKIAIIPQVRTALLEKQRAFANTEQGLIADGRDMGTVVFPNADVKIFLDASIEERAKRRYKQLQESKISGTFEKIFQDIKERDYRDRNRSVAPLTAAIDALTIDSTHLSLNQVIQVALEYIFSKVS